MPKLSVLSSIAGGKCPRCRKGNMFKKNILSPFNLTDMKKNCDHCDLRFEKEPGFFNGALYVSYGISTGLFLVIGFSVFFIFNDPPSWVYITIITSVVLLVFPYNLKYSRVLFLYAFGDESYDEKYTSD